MHRAKYWNCEEYREPHTMRHRTAKTKMILIEDVSSNPVARDRWARRLSAEHRKSRWQGWSVSGS
jgi:hypothetical protein